MLQNEENRVALSKQSGMVILRAFQLLRAKIKHWADLKNVIKERNYKERSKAYEVAKKQFRIYKRQMLYLEDNRLNSAYRLIDTQILQGRLPEIRDKFDKVRFTYPACEERLSKLLQN